MKPRLTQKVLDGLMVMVREAQRVESQQWKAVPEFTLTVDLTDDVGTAVEWIKATRKYREERQRQREATNA